MFQITQTINGNGATLIWLPMEFYVHLVEKVGNLTESSFFEISTSNLEHNFFRFLDLILYQF